MSNNSLQQSFTGMLLEVSSRSDLNFLPARTNHGGHIYLIEFSDGTVKAGKSINPRSRMNQHYGESIRYDISMSRVWVSPEHKNYAENEVTAMEACAQHGEISGGREYFSGAELFDQVKPMLENLEFLPGGSDGGMSMREWVQDYIEAEHAKYDLEKLQEMLGETPVVLLHQLGLLHHNESSPQKLYDWVMNDESYDSYEKRLDMLDLYMKLADLYDMPAKDFLDMDYFEKTELLIHRMVSSQIRLLRAVARNEGMDDLLHPIRENILDAAESVGL